MPIHALKSQSHYDEVVSVPRPTVVFKHSPSCGRSYLAMNVVKGFAADHPEVEVYVVDVLDQRDLSEAIADRHGIRHESPQSIVMVGGEAVWSGSHASITAESLRQRVKLAEADAQSPKP